MVNAARGCNVSGVPLGAVHLGAGDATARGVAVVGFSALDLLFALLAVRGCDVGGVPLGAVRLGAGDATARGVVVVEVRCAPLLLTLLAGSQCEIVVLVALFSCFLIALVTFVIIATILLAGPP